MFILMKQPASKTVHLKTGKGGEDPDEIIRIHKRFF